MMVAAYANLQGALLNLMEALVAAYIVKVTVTQCVFGSYQSNIKQVKLSFWCFATARGSSPTSGHEVCQHGVCPGSRAFKVSAAAGCWRPVSTTKTVCNQLDQESDSTCVRCSRKPQACWCVCFRREEVASEAQRVLRAFPKKNSEKEGPKPMPSFPDMVAYIQEKVRIVYRATRPHYSFFFFFF